MVVFGGIAGRVYAWNCRGPGQGANDAISAARVGEINSVAASGSVPAGEGGQCGSGGGGEWAARGQGRSPRAAQPGGVRPNDDGAGPVRESQSVASAGAGPRRSCPTVASATKVTI